MTLIALPDYEALQGRMDAGAQQALLNTMGAYLKANSVDGDAAARIGEDRFGLIHEADLDLDELQQKIGDFTREADPTGQGIAVEAATVEVDPSTVSEEDLANGLVYAINKFRNTEGKDFSVQQLSTNLSSLVSQAADSVKAFKKVVSEAEFEVALQPIIDVMTGQVHHYEALVRILRRPRRAIALRTNRLRRGDGIDPGVRPGHGPQGGGVAGPHAAQLQDQRRRQRLGPLGGVARLHEWTARTVDREPVAARTACCSRSPNRRA